MKLVCNLCEQIIRVLGHNM